MSFPRWKSCTSKKLQSGGHGMPMRYQVGRTNMNTSASGYANGVLSFNSTNGVYGVMQGRTEEAEQLLPLEIPSDRETAAKVATGFAEQAYKERKLKSIEEHIEFWLLRQITSSYMEISRAFRVTGSPIEVITYLHLSHWFPCIGPNEPPVIGAQFNIGPYFVDFLVLYGKYKFVIECDGHDFHEKTKKQAAHDKKRDRFLTSKGYIVLRFTGSEIWNNPTIVTETLDDYLYEDSLRDDEGVVPDGQPEDDSQVHQHIETSQSDD